MSDESFKELAAALTHTARSAGELIRRYRGQNSDVTYKDDGSPVTHVDRTAEELILNDLARIAPGITAIGEESAAVLPEGFNRDAPFFLVDPLDGTKEFVRGGKEYTINIALIKDRKPAFGLIYAPELQVIYVTVSRTEAVCARLAPERGEALDALATTVLRTRDPGSERLKAIVSRSHRNAETDDFVAALPPHDMVELSSALKLAVVADGGADIYPRLSSTSEWDTAAGHAILNAAGGALRTADGQPLLYGKRETNLLNPGFIAVGRSAIGERLKLAGFDGDDDSD
jgi:3'(2'), 5'-bisphosphate nucleotidase